MFAYAAVFTRFLANRNYLTASMPSLIVISAVSGYGETCEGVSSSACVKWDFSKTDLFEICLEFRQRACWCTKLQHLTLTRFGTRIRKSQNLRKESTVFLGKETWIERRAARSVSVEGAAASFELLGGNAHSPVDLQISQGPTADISAREIGTQGRPSIQAMTALRDTQHLEAHVTSEASIPHRLSSANFNVNREGISQTVSDNQLPQDLASQITALKTELHRLLRGLTIERRMRCPLSNWRIITILHF
jgi:hypothetical protein